MTHIFNNYSSGKDKVTQITVNGQTFTVTGEVQNISVNNGSISINSGSKPEPVEPFTDDVPESVTERVSGMNRRVDSDLINGSLIVDGMNADIEIRVLNGFLKVDGMGADISVDFMGPNSELIVSGMNATVRVNDAVLGAIVKVSGLGTRLYAPATIATTCEVSGMNSKMKFH